MDGMTIFVIVILVIAVLGGAFCFFYMQSIKKKESGETSVSSKQSSKTPSKTTSMSTTSGSSGALNSADWFPVKEIRDGIVLLNDYSFRMFIEVSSINYGLRTADEQDRIEALFGRFLNSIKYPFSIYIQSRQVNLDEFLENIQKNAENSATENLKRYNQLYYRDMSENIKNFETMKQKRKYVIISFNDSTSITNLSDEEKWDYAKDELYVRAANVIGELETIGLKCHILNTGDVYGVFYSSLHPNTKEYISKLYGDWDTDVVGHTFNGKDIYTNKNVLKSQDVLNRLLTCVSGVQTQIKTENAYVSDEEKEVVNYIINDFQEIIEALETQVNKNKEEGDN